MIHLVAACIISGVVMHQKTRHKRKIQLVKKKQKPEVPVKTLIEELFATFKFYEREECEIVNHYKRKILGKEVSREDLTELMRKVKSEVNSRKFTWDTYVHMSVLTRRVCSGKMLRKVDWLRMKNANLYTGLRKALYPKELLLLLVNTTV